MRRVHGWLAIVFALPLLLASLSGALLGFARESDRMVHAALLTAPISTASPLSPERWLAAARQAHPHPEMRVIGMGLPVTPVDTVLVLMEDASGARHEVHVHPRTGEVRGGRPTETGLYHFAWRLHTTLLVDETGGWITRMAALGLLFTVLSGLFLRRQAQGQGVIGRTHPLLGLTTAPVLALIATTGLLFLAWQPHYGNIQRLGLSESPPAFNLADPSPALAALKTRQRECVPRWLEPLAGEAVRIACEEPRHAGTLGVRWFTWSPAEGLTAQAIGPRAGELLYDLHTGELLGMPGRILWVIASLAIPFLILGGLASRAARRGSSTTKIHHDE